jgi:hypothetical protein
MSNIDSFLSTLNTLSEKNSFEVYIPSLKRNVLFKPITTGQQRSLYLCISDNSLFRTKFISTTFQIIKDNCTEPNLLQKLTVIDRIAILLAFRKNTLGTDIIVEKDDVQYSTNFESNLELVKTISLPENKTINVKGIQIDLQVPLVLDQYGIEKELREGLATSMPLNEAIEESILNEVCKMVGEIYIDSNKVNYNSFSYKERLQILEKLPAEFIFEVQNFAETVNKVIDELLTVKVDNENSIGFDLTVDFFLER